MIGSVVGKTMLLTRLRAKTPDFAVEVRKLILTLFLCKGSDQRLAKKEN
jgi:hypothetical protein